MWLEPLIRLQRQRLMPWVVPISALKQRNIVAIEEIETSFYMRFSALDKPGVLSEITKIMGDTGISIEAIVQKEQPMVKIMSM